MGVIDPQEVRSVEVYGSCGDGSSDSAKARRQHGSEEAGNASGRSSNRWSSSFMTSVIHPSRGANPMFPTSSRAMPVAYSAE